MISVINSPETEGVSCDLEIDGSNIPHVSYVGESFDNPLSGIKCATLDGEIGK